jgi:hypothetical protein
VAAWGTGAFPPAVQAFTGAEWSLALTAAARCSAIISAMPLCRGHLGPSSISINLISSLCQKLITISPFGVSSRPRPEQALRLSLGGGLAILRDIYYSIGEQTFREGKMRSVRALVLVGCVLLAITVEAGTVHEVPVTLRFRLADPHSPTFYVRWEDHQLRIARSEKELETATPLRLERMDFSYYLSKDISLRDNCYAEMKLAGRVGSFSEVCLQPMVSIYVSGVLSGEQPNPQELGEAFAPTFHFRYRDASGARWDYLVGSWWQLTPPDDGAGRAVTEVPVPDPRQLALSLSAAAGDPEEAEGQVYIKVIAQLGQERLDDLLRTEESVPVRLVARDSRRKVVRSAESALPRLKYEPRKGAYSMQLPEGHYVITATIGPTPFSKAVTASEQVIVE